MFVAGLALFERLLLQLGEVDLAPHLMATYGKTENMRWAQATSAPAVPTTNNALERYNRTFKREASFHERKSADSFVTEVLKQFLHVKSVLDKSFPLEPKV